jgi:inner membrane protein
MNDFSILESTFRNRLRSLSMGVKLVVICVLALLMMIPAFFVSDLVRERTQRASDVVREISSHVGGQQTFLGPTLCIPYTIPAQSGTDSTKHGVYIVFPAQASATIKTTTEDRHRSLFKVPVFQADLKLDAAFDLTGVPVSAPQGAELDWSHAEIVVGVSDARGALADATLAMAGRTVTLTPSRITEHLLLGQNQSERLRLVTLAAAVDPAAKPDAKFSVTASLRFSGAQHIALLAYGKSTQLSMQGDWPSPGFDGGFLPASRSVSASGFRAEWSVPFIARGVRAEGPADSLSGLDATSLGVSFIEVADPYQSVSRSLKYLPLFLGLIFLSYFAFEVTTRKRVHPAQYVLVGMAQLIFYLLLLSFAERVGFDWAFLVAGSATVTLLSTNAGWIFSSRMQGLRAMVLFGLLYVLIYLLLRLEDNALLVGAVASFLAVASAMYLTRGIDWYRPLPSVDDTAPQTHA